MLQGLAPVVGRASRLLVLGSFPGEASLAAGRYYAHPRNQFWPILARALGEPLVDWPFERRYRAVIAAGFAIWDVYAGCRREGSLDSSIRDAAQNDFESLLRRGCAPCCSTAGRRAATSPGSPGAAWRRGCSRRPARPMRG